METKPLYISLFILVFVGLVITPLINTFSSESDPSHIPLGSTFMSALIGNDFASFPSLEENINYDFSKVDDFQFLYTFLDTFPNYDDMDELKDKTTGEQNIFLHEVFIIDGEEVPIFIRYDVQQQFFVVPQPSSFTDRLICAIAARCTTVQNFKFVEVADYGSIVSRFLNIINPYRLLLPESLRDKIDEYLMTFGYLPQTISEPLMLIIVLGFSVTNILLLIKLISLLPFIG